MMLARALTVLSLLLAAAYFGWLALVAVGNGSFLLTLLFGMLAFVFTAGAAHTLRDKN